MERSGRARKGKLRKGLLLAGGVLLILIAALLVVPPFINLGAYKARYLPLVEQAVRRKVDVADVRLRILPTPSIRVSRLIVADNPAFSEQPFFAAQELRLKLKFRPLLRGVFQVEEFTLENPSVNLIKQKDGIFNFADIAKPKQPPSQEKIPREAPAKTKEPEPVRLSELIPSLVSIDHGMLTLQTKGEEPLKLEGIDLSVKDFSPDQPFPYRLAVKAPGLKPVSLEGILSYDENKANLSLNQNRLQVEEVDFSVNGAIGNLTSVPQVNLTLANDGFEVKPIVRLLSVMGRLPKEMEISGPMALRVSVTGPSSAIVPRAVAQLKGLTLNDPRTFNGTVTGDVDLALPLGGETSALQALRGRGKIVAKEGVLTNVDLVSKIQQITGIIGLTKREKAGATTFRTLESDFTLSGGVANIERIFLDSPLMEVTGGGKMNLSPATLELGLDAALSPSVSARAGGRAGAFLRDAKGRVVVPLKITGPAQGPAVSVDSQKLLQRGPGRTFQEGAKGLLDRLFRRK
jgi:AsmA protein